MVGFDHQRIRQHELQKYHITSDDFSCYPAIEGPDLILGGGGLNLLSDCGADLGARRCKEPGSRTEKVNAQTGGARAAQVIRLTREPGRRRGKGRGRGRAPGAGRP